MVALARVEHRWDLRVSGRDRQILERARAKLARGGCVEFGDAIRALQEAVEESIPAGRVFFLGAHEHGPVVGSLVSGVGIVESAGGIAIVRVHEDAALTWLGSFEP
jgi:hypothetical protein